MKKQAIPNKKADITSGKRNPIVASVKPPKADESMHAAEGDDDTMSEPQGKAPVTKQPSKPNGKKSS
jgi:hypothetical protein